MKRLFIAALCSFVVVVGCAWLGLQTPSSVCDDMAPGESVLCDLADKYDLHLETVGNLFLVVNLRAGGKEGAVEFFEGLKEKSSIGVPVMDLRKYILDNVDKAPEIILIAPYLSHMNVPAPIKKTDKDLLDEWINGNLKLLQ